MTEILPTHATIHYAAAHVGLDELRAMAEGMLSREAGNKLAYEHLADQVRAGRYSCREDERSQLRPYLMTLCGVSARHKLVSRVMDPDCGHRLPAPFMALIPRDPDGLEYPFRHCYDCVDFAAILMEGAELACQTMGIFRGTEGDLTQHRLYHAKREREREEARARGEVVPCVPIRISGLYWLWLLEQHGLDLAEERFDGLTWYEYAASGESLYRALRQWREKHVPEGVLGL